MATIKLLGLQRDFQVHQGNDISFTLELFDVGGMPLDLSDSILMGEWRYQNGRVAFTGTLANGIFSWINQAEGKARVRVPAATTAGLQWPKEVPAPESIDLVYDIEVHSTNPTLGVFKPCFGTVTVTREQTRLA